MTKDDGNGDKPESCAQVESFVGQKTVGQNSCGLKPGKSPRKPRVYRLVARFSDEEREIIVRQAKEARMTPSAFIRLTLIKAPALDPDRHKKLLQLNLELTRQGNNLNQIARQLNAGTVTPAQADTLLAMIARPMIQAHRALRDALAQDRAKD